MSKKDKKDKEFKVLRLTKENIEGFERAGINSSVVETGSVYYLGKLKKEDGETYYKPYAPDGKLYVTAISRPKTESKFEKAIANFAGAAIAAGTFRSIEVVEAIAKPVMDDFLVKDKTTTDFSRVTGFTCVLPKESDLQKDLKDSAKDIFKAAAKVEKLGKKAVKEIYDLDADLFETFAVEGNDLSDKNMWDYYDSIQDARKEENDIPIEEEEMPDLTAEEYSEEEDDEEEYDDEEEDFDGDDEEEEDLEF